MWISSVKSINRIINFYPLTFCWSTVTIPNHSQSRQKTVTQNIPYYIHSYQINDNNISLIWLCWRDETFKYCGKESLLSAQEVYKLQQGKCYIHELEGFRRKNFTSWFLPRGSHLSSQHYSLTWLNFFQSVLLLKFLFQSKCDSFECQNTI